MIEEIGLLPRHRELLAPPHRTGAWRAAADPVRLSPERCAADRRRVPSDRSTDSRDVLRRSLAQGRRWSSTVSGCRPRSTIGRSILTSGKRARRRRSSCRPRLDPTNSARLQGVVVEQIIRPTGLIDPPIEVRPVKGQVDDLLERDPRPRRDERAGAGHDADQADVRGPDQVLPGARRPRALSPLGYRDARARADSSRLCARANSTCWWASTCCARGSTCPRCRSSRFSTPTRKASCASGGSLIQTSGRAARNVNGRVIMYAER